VQPEVADQVDWSSEQRTAYGFLYLALDTCMMSTELVEASLRAGNSAAARRAFQKAEEALEEAHWYLPEIDREDWRSDAQTMLDDIGQKLDGFWVNLISRGYVLRRRSEQTH
jgi:hypothetical protein